MLASRPDAFDPMDRALIDAGARVLGGTKHLHRKWSLERKSPIASDRLAVVHA
jgi:Ca2+-transporting ATPase